MLQAETPHALPCSGTALSMPALVPLPQTDCIHLRIPMTTALPQKNKCRMRIPCITRSNDLSQSETLIRHYKTEPVFSLYMLRKMRIPWHTSEILERKRFWSSSILLRKRFLLPAIFCPKKPYIPSAARYGLPARLLRYRQFLQDIINYNFDKLALKHLRRG